MFVDDDVAALRGELVDHVAAIARSGNIGIAALVAFPAAFDVGPALRRPVPQQIWFLPSNETGEDNGPSQVPKGIDEARDRSDGGARVGDFERCALTDEIILHVDDEEGWIAQPLARRDMSSVNRRSQF